MLFTAMKKQEAL